LFKGNSLRENDLITSSAGKLEDPFVTQMRKAVTTLSRRNGLQKRATKCANHVLLAAIGEPLVGLFS